MCKSDIIIKQPQFGCGNIPATLNLKDREEIVHRSTRANVSPRRRHARALGVVRQRRADDLAKESLRDQLENPSSRHRIFGKNPLSVDRQRHLNSGFRVCSRRSMGGEAQHKLRIRIVGRQREVVSRQAVCLNLTKQRRNNS